jgi:aryl-alcohol dehydrogenase-like predicted oxidoreductase
MRRTGAIHWSTDMATRRQALTAFGVAAFGASLPAAAAEPTPKPVVVPLRTLGRTGRVVTPFGLGGQAALQYNMPNTDPADIVVRAVELGVTYLDTSNMYGDSQLHYGEAFRRLNLVPGKAGYNSALRQSLFLTSKTTQIYGNDTEGPEWAPKDRTALDDLKRSLTQLFGDGKGFIPEGAYLDSMLMHNVNAHDEVEARYTGMDARGGKMPKKIGVFAMMLDYRDGTNYTGLNPEHRRWIRHVGISGHTSEALTEAIRRDDGNNLDTVLIPLNVADRLFMPFQTNLLPLARAKGMGVIAMKVFADGALVGKGAHWTEGPSDVITNVGDVKKRASFHDMIRYPLSLPGVSCAIIGIGHIDRADPSKDQLVADIAASIDAPLTPEERAAIEKRVAEAFGATTNYFQQRAKGLIQPTEVKATKLADRVVVSWQAGFAGAEPVRWYHIRAGGKTVLTIPAREQLTTAPLTAFLTPEEAAGGAITVIASDAVSPA